MLVVFRYKGFRFFFYSNEGNPREPVHVHVRFGSSEAKLGLEPQVRVAASFGFDAGIAARVGGSRTEQSSTDREDLA